MFKDWSFNYYQTSIFLIKYFKQLGMLYIEIYSPEGQGFFKGE